MARSSALDACGVLRLLAVVAVMAWSSAARAQATSWLYVGGGAGVFDVDDQKSRPAIQVDTGIGTSAEHALVAGGIFRLQGYFDQGVDLAGALRLVTRGLAIGGFGVGVDAGVYQRFWGPGSTGFNGDVVLGAPWGLTLLGGASIGSGDQRVYFVSLGLDFARLTVHRNTGLEWFENPMRSPEQ